MTRIPAYILGILLIAAVLCAPALFWGMGDADASNAVPGRITGYHASFEVGADGQLSAVEQIDVDTRADADGDGDGSLVRAFDRYDAHAPHARRDPENITVMRDGQPQPYETQSRGLGRYAVLTVGSPDDELSAGMHQYTISYTIAGVLLPDDADPARAWEHTGGSLFDWAVVPGGWQQEMDDVTVDVALPSAAVLPAAPPTAPERAGCVVGQGAAATACQLDGDMTQHLSLHLDHLAAGTSVTIGAGIGVDTPPEGDHVPWTARLDPVMGTRPALLVLVVLVGIGGAIAGGLLAGSSRQRRPAYPIRFVPPAGLGPAQAVHLMTDRVPREAIIGSLLHAAERGVIRIERRGTGWAIVRTAPGTDLDPITLALVQRLVGTEVGAVLTINRKDAADGRFLASVVDAFEQDVTAWAIASGNVSRTGLGPRSVALVIAGVVLAGACLLLRPLGMSMPGIIPGALVVAGVSTACAGAGTKRTGRGRRHWSQAGGFQRMLAAPASEQRFDFSNHPELYGAYLPWAVALGCAPQWGKKYRAQTGSEPPVPSIVVGPTGAGSVVTDAMVHDLSSTMGSAISAYRATQQPLA